MNTKKIMTTVLVLALVIASMAGVASAVSFSKTVGSYSSTTAATLTKSFSSGSTTVDVRSPGYIRKSGMDVMSISEQQNIQPLAAGVEMDCTVWVKNGITNYYGCAMTVTNNTYQKQNISTTYTGTASLSLGNSNDFVIVAKGTWTLSSSKI